MIPAKAERAGNSYCTIQFTYFTVDSYIHTYIHAYTHIHKYILPYVYERRQVTCFCCAAFETKFLSTDSFSAATETSKYPKFVIFILSMYLSLCLATVDSHWNSSVATLATWWRILVTASGKCCCWFGGRVSHTYIHTYLYTIHIQCGKKTH